MVSAFTVFVFRTFFQGLPDGLVEAAKIDGAGEFRIFFTIILPLSTPVLATMGFLNLQAQWNDWNTTLLYNTRKSDLYSLQYLLQRILRDVEFIKKSVSEGSSLFNASDVPSESLRYAMAIVAAGPMLVIFPFFQKYFSKGLTVGSVKG